MRSPWLAVEAGTDLLARALFLGDSDWLKELAAEMNLTEGARCSERSTARTASVRRRPRITLRILEASNS